MGAKRDSRSTRGQVEGTAFARNRVALSLAQAAIRASGAADAGAAAGNPGTASARGRDGGALPGGARRRYKTPLLRPQCRESRRIRRRDVRIAPVLPAPAGLHYVHAG